MNKSQELLELLEAAGDKTYFNIDHLGRSDIELLKKGLTKSGLVIGKDFFVKSGHSCWILNTKYDTKQADILSKYGAEEE